MGRISISVNQNFWNNVDNFPNSTKDKYGHVHFTVRKNIKKEGEKSCSNQK